MFQNPQMYQYQNPYQFKPMNNGIIWVNGIEGAKAYQLAPNSNAILMDSENDNIFYIKVSDNIGMSSLRTFRFDEIHDFEKSSVQTLNADDYVTREEFNKLLKDLGEAKDE